MNQEPLAGTVILSPRSGSLVLWVDGEYGAARLVHLDGTTGTEALDSIAMGSATSRQPTSFAACFDQVLRCPVCGAHVDGATPVFSVQQLFWKVPLRQCRQCGLVYKTWQPRPSILQAIYEGEYSNFGAAKCPPGADVANPRVDRLGTERGRHLDIGCGDGGFVAAARHAGFESYGVDPFLPEVADAVKPWVKKGDILDEHFRAGLGRYDVVSLWAVWEHLSHPLDTLRASVELLKPGGRIVLNCPHGRSLHALRRGSSWHMATLFEHLSFLTAATCRHIATQLGLDLKRLRYCGSPYPFGTGAVGVAGQGLNDAALCRMFSIPIPSQQSSPSTVQQPVAARKRIAERLRMGLVSLSRIPSVARGARYLLDAGRIGDHLEVYLQCRGR